MMRNIRNNKFLLSLLCFALLGFAVLSIGGNYFHSAVHHHDHGTDQACPLYQFLVQAFIVAVLVLAAARLERQVSFINTYQFFFHKTIRFIFYLRGPPSFI
ncbi:MAG: hypothetical protein KC684_09005 [Candidatus Omnitrophica bacterium]|nr:hypothetical protein [Candidatus Omnitrophota bacterium]